MTYDAADGYVVLYGGAISLSLPYSNETWAFDRGHWARVETTGSPPGLLLPYLAYDPALGETILYGGFRSNSGFWNNHTWAYRDGTWTRLSDGPYVPPVWDGGLTYDPAGGDLLLFGGALGRGTNVTWIFSGTGWTKSPLPSPSPRGGEGLASDPLDGYAVLFGGQSNSGILNDTWLATDGSWSQLKVPGPPPRWVPGMTFDPALGGTLLFGGASYGCCGTPSALSDTWLFSVPATNLSVSITGSPTAICSTIEPVCPAGAAVENVTLSVEAAPAGGPTNDASNLTIQYGPFRWMDAPVLTFVPWKNFTLESGTTANATCWVGGVIASCPSGSLFTLPNSGPTGLKWSWNATSRDDTLHAGDAWSVSFAVQTDQPPGGTVPVDSCATAACTHAGIGGREGVFTSVEFSPFGNSTTTNLSFGPLLVHLLKTPPLTSPPSTTPPPSPPVVPNPLPSPPVSSPVPQPISSPIAAVIGSGVISVSTASIAAGVLAAGFTRVTLHARGQAQKNAVLQRSGRVPQGDRAGTRGE
jgi:hypothetical protein